MKKLLYLFLIGLLSLTFSCKESTEKDNTKDDKDDNIEVKVDEKKCELDLEDFRTFCGIKDGQTLDDVIELYGKPDSIAPVDGDSYWAYFFINSTYPLTVEAAEKDGKIWTVYMEILSIDYMYSDIETAIDLLHIDDCVGSLLGEDIDYAEKVLGKNYSYEAKSSYDSYIYDDEDFSIEVVLDYYYEQYTKCTRIMVYFFDQLPED
ncbi:MAG: hypothetical protein JXL97_12415 [Bacteroidales bacterium]|nr:hypothetical protein [Bacteroidales bacterium]